MLNAPRFRHRPQHVPGTHLAAWLDGGRELPGAFPVQGRGGVAAADEGTGDPLESPQGPEDAVERPTQKARTQLNGEGSAHRPDGFAEADALRVFEDLSVDGIKQQKCLHTRYADAL